MGVTTEDLGFGCWQEARNFPNLHNVRTDLKDQPAPYTVGV